MFGKQKNKQKYCEEKGTSSELAKKSCQRKLHAFTDAEIASHYKLISDDWQIKQKKLVRIYSIDKYIDMISLVNRIVEISEREDHHPILHIYYCRLEVEIFTFSLDSLSENDFILAAKIDSVVCCR